MKRLSLHLRLFLLIVLALTPALVVALLYVRGIGGGAAWRSSLFVVVAYLAALVAFWFVIPAWFGPMAPDGDAAVEDSSRPAPPVPLEPAGGPVDEGQTREQLQADLAQRHHMLRELHHRVKNNLQMISSLLSLQADRIRSPRIRRVFADAQNRVLTLSVLHRHLYERSNWSQVDFQAFLNDLVRHLSVDHGTGGQPAARFSIAAPVLPVGPDTAIPIGLIVTEAVGNAFRHGFAGIENPQITIRAQISDGQFELAIEDNGVGIAPDVAALADQGGLGFTLFRGLAAQLGGEAIVSRRAEGGTQVLVRFASPYDDAVDDAGGERKEAVHERGEGARGTSAAP